MLPAPITPATAEPAPVFGKEDAEVGLLLVGLFSGLTGSGSGLSQPSVFLTITKALSWMVFSTIRVTTAYISIRKTDILQSAHIIPYNPPITPGIRSADGMTTTKAGGILIHFPMSMKTAKATATSFSAKTVLSASGSDSEHTAGGLTLQTSCPTMYLK